MDSIKTATMDFEEILLKYQRPVLTIAWRMLGNWEEARDAVQESFIRFWKMTHPVENPDDHFSLLARIVTNRCIDLLRRRRWKTWLSLESITGLIATENPEKALDDKNLEQTIQDSANRLKPKQKAAFLLRDVEGYSVKETAELIGDTENQVRVNLHLARKNMRKWLRPFLEE